MTFCPACVWWPLWNRRRPPGQSGWRRARLPQRVSSSIRWPRIGRIACWNAHRSSAKRGGVGRLRLPATVGKRDFMGPPVWLAFNRARAARTGERANARQRAAERIGRSGHQFRHIVHGRRDLDPSPSHHPPPIDGQARGQRRVGVGRDRLGGDVRRGAVRRGPRPGRVRSRARKATKATTGTAPDAAPAGGDVRSSSPAPPDNASPPSAPETEQSTRRNRTNST